MDLEEIKKSLPDLTYREQVQLLDAIAEQLSFSAGSNMIAAGSLRVASDLGDEQIATDAAAWSYGRFAAEYEGALV